MFQFKERLAYEATSPLSPSAARHLGEETRAPMDFSSPEGRVITDPVEASQVPMYEGGSWRVSYGSLI